MPGEGSLPALYVGNKFIDYLPPSGAVLRVIDPDGTVKTIITRDGAFPALTVDGALIVPGAFTAEDVSTFEAAATFEDDVDVEGETTLGNVVIGGTVGGQIRWSGAGFVGLGAAEDATVDGGVLTVTGPYVNVLPEDSNADTVDSIVYADAAEGDLLLVTSKATNTITFDNSVTMLLGAGTRAVAPGGSITFQKVGTTWVERTFLTAAS